VPALRGRLADLEALVDTLSEDIARRSGMPHRTLSADALDRLAQHAWPGNIRELRNALEQASLMTDDLLLTAAHFESIEVGSVFALRASDAAPALQPATNATNAIVVKPLSEAVAELEGRAIRDAMAATGGNKLAASRLLGISRATLYEKLALAQRAGAAVRD
jgi:DNA-binding NtrC family response regulator